MIYNCRICGRDVDWETGHGCANATPDNERHRLTLKERDEARAEIESKITAINELHVKLVDERKAANRLRVEVAELQAGLERAEVQLFDANKLIHARAKDVPRLIQPGPFDLACYAYESRYGVFRGGKHMFESDGKKRCAVEGCGLGISADCHTLPQPPPSSGVDDNRCARKSCGHSRQAHNGSDCVLDGPDGKQCRCLVFLSWYRADCANCDGVGCSNCDKGAGK